MEYPHYRDHYRHAVTMHRLGMAIIGVLAVGVAVLAVCVSMKQRTVRDVFVPLSSTQPFWVENNRVSESYLANMAEYVVNQYLTVTVSNQDHQAQQLLTLAAPDVHAALRVHLAQRAAHVRRESMSTQFYPQTVDVESTHRCATVKGRLHAYVQQHQLFDKPAAYRVCFRLARARLWLVSVTEDKSIKGGMHAAS